MTSHRGGRRYAPYAFTEQGVTMLSGVLSSKRAIQVNIAIVRAFVKLRELLSTHKDVVEKLAEIERVQRKHGACIDAIWQHVNQLLSPPEPSKKYRIGFPAGAGKALTSAAGRK